MIIDTKLLILADQFYLELDGEFEVLTDIAYQYGPRTLSGVLYLWRAIQTGGFIDDWQPEMNVQAVVERLPSWQTWSSYIRVLNEEGKVVRDGTEARSPLDLDKAAITYSEREAQA